MRPKVPPVPLEFMDVFKIDDDTDDNALVPDDGLGDSPDPIGKIIAKFVDDDALAKRGVSGVSDCAWSSPMVTPIEAVFENAGESALTAVKKFVRSNAQLLNSERVDCSALQKSFREDQKCQRR
jgi:hypothetical protein